MERRRELLLSSWVLLAPFATFAQPAARVRRIGVLGNLKQSAVASDLMPTFIATLRDQGGAKVSHLPSSIDSLSNAMSVSLSWLGNWLSSTLISSWSLPAPTPLWPPNSQRRRFRSSLSVSVTR